MPFPHLIIDGYSLLHRDAAVKKLLGRNLALARRQLIEKLERHGGAIADRITVVFDGRGAQEGASIESRHIEVLFSDGTKTADTMIEQFVHSHGNPDSLWIVTSDRMERETVEAAGAHTLPCIELLERLETGARDTARQLRTPAKKLRPTLGDLM